MLIFLYSYYCSTLFVHDSAENEISVLAEVRIAVAYVEVRQAILLIGLRMNVTS